MSIAEPPVALAGEPGTWRLTFRLAGPVQPGEAVKLQIHARRNNRPDWNGLQADSAPKAGHVTAEGPAGESLDLRADEQAGLFILTAPGAGLAAGETVTVTIGDTSGGSVGASAPTISAYDKFFVLFRPDGPKDMGAVWNAESTPRILAACMMRVLGSRSEALRVYAPSEARPLEDFTILVRPVDAHLNLASDTVGELAAFVGETPLGIEREDVANSTCVRLRAKLAGEGVFRVRVADAASGLEGVSNPIVCSGDAGDRLYWGMIHGHTEMSDGTGSLDNYFRQMRDEARLDFAGTGDHDHDHETPDWMWNLTCRKVEEWDSPGEFATLLGYEWAKWRRNGDGDRNVYYAQGSGRFLRSGEEHHPHPPDLFRALAGEKALVIPHHTGHSGNFCDWKDHDPRLERLVEIFQIRGSYECSASDGNPVPERAAEPPFEDGFLRRALAMGWRVGFTAGGDDHMGHAGTDFLWSQTGYGAGLMAVRAGELTRSGVFGAMYDRRAVATTGARIILDYSVSGHAMGSEVSASDEPALEAAREIAVRFHGTAPLERIDVIRNGEVVHSDARGGLDVELSWRDEAPLAEALLPAGGFSPGPFCYYYVRAVQGDGEVAWASPTWIDPAEGQ